MRRSLCLLLTQPLARSRRRVLPKEAPMLKEFLQGSAPRDALPHEPIDLGGVELPPYLPAVDGAGRKVFIQSYVRRSHQHRMHELTSWPGLRYEQCRQ